MCSVAFLFFATGAAQFFQPASLSSTSRTGAVLPLESGKPFPPGGPAAVEHVAVFAVFAPASAARHTPRSPQDGAIVSGLAVFAYALVLVAAGRLGVAAFSVYGSERQIVRFPSASTTPLSIRRASQVRMALASGDALGDISFTTQDGAAVTNDSLKGQRALFWIYPKADTGGCTAEGTLFNDKKEEFAAKGVRILGVSRDTPAENNAWKEKQGFGYDLLTDSEKVLDKMVLGEDGGRWAVLVDADGKVEKVWPKVQPAFPKKCIDEI